MKKTYLWLLLIIALASFFRLYNLPQTPPGLYPDEAMNGNNALEALHTGEYKIFYPENNGREGLFINLQAAFLGFLESSDVSPTQPWALRFPSAIFGVLTVLGLYFLTKELFHFENQDLFRISRGELIALLSSFFLAVSFWHINFSRVGFRAIMAPAFLIWALYFFLKTIKLSSRQRRYNNWKLKIENWSLPIIAGAIMGLGFYSYIAYRALPLLFLIFIPFLWRSKRFWQATAAFIVGAIITSAPLGLYFFNHPADFLGRTSQISVFSSASPLKDLTVNTLKTAAMFNFTGDGNWRHNLAGAPELYWPVGILFLIGLILALKNIFFSVIPAKAEIQKIKNWNLFGIWNLKFVILLTWLLISALPVIISNEGLPHALRAILMIPPVFILAGIGGVWIYEYLKNILPHHRRLLFILSLVFLATITINAYNTYFLKWATNPATAASFNQDYVNLAAQLNSLPPAIPKYVIVKSVGVDVRGLPMPAQTVMFLTDTFLPESRVSKNIFYLLPSQTGSVPPTALLFHI